MTIERSSRVKRATPRRSFGLCVAALMTTVSVVGCGGGSSSGGSSSAPVGGSSSSTDASELDRDATLRISHSITIDQFDPLKKASDIPAIPWYRLVYDNLVKVDQDNEVVPELASSYEASSDDLVWTFDLREGTTFHDGTPIDGEAVVANFQRLLDGKDSNPLVGGYLGKVASVTAPDASTVVFTLSEPDQAFPLSVATPLSSIAAPSAFETLDTNPVGSGPFTLDDFSPQGASFDRWEQYWDVEHIPSKRIEFTPVADGQARLTAIQTGRYDLGGFSPIFLPQIDALPDDDQIAVEQAPHTGVQMMFLNTSHPPLDNPDVRRALSLMIDRKTIAEELYAGLVQPTASPLSPGIDGYVSSIEEQYTYDPDEAQRLLDEAGVDDLTLTVIISDAPGVGSYLGPVLQAMFAEHGITLDVVAKPAVDSQAIWRSGEGDIFLQFANLNSFDSLAYLQIMYAGLNNPGGLEADSPIQAALDEAAALPLDSPDRVGAIEAVVEVIADNPIHIALASQDSTWVVSSRVVGIDRSPYLRTAILFFDPRYVGLTAS